MTSLFNVVRVWREFGLADDFVSFNAHILNEVALAWPGCSFQQRLNCDRFVLDVYTPEGSCVLTLAVTSTWDTEPELEIMLGDDDFRPISELIQAIEQDKRARIEI